MSLVNLILYCYWCVTRVNEFVKTFKQHDTTADCSPGGSAGNYIMFARATSGDKPNNRRFSPCSRSKMNAVMEVKGRCQDSKCCFKGTVSYLFKMYYGNSSLNPLANSPNWSLYISLKNKLREFEKRSKHFLFGDHLINSHNLISWHCMDIVRRKFMLVTIGT